MGAAVSIWLRAHKKIVKSSVEILWYLNKMTIFSRWFNYFWPRDVIFGRKPLVGVGNVGLAHHWAIKVNLALTILCIGRTVNDVVFRINSAQNVNNFFLTLQNVKAK